MKVLSVKILRMQHIISFEDNSVVILLLIKLFLAGA